ncbi:ADP-ribosylation [Schizophyllum commune Loenen D]|nr:ADP-ribosylation [Schizophyllum commune Loenen D]
MYNNAYHGSRSSDRNGQRGVEIGTLFGQPSNSSYEEDLYRLAPPLHELILGGPCVFCVYCGRRHSGKQSTICSRWCENSLYFAGPNIVNIPRHHAAFASVADQFEQSWRHPHKRCPTVRRIYLIISSFDVVSRYEAYQQTVEAYGDFTAVGRSPGNENRRWHGTRRECWIGEKDQTRPCNSSTCSLCCIIRKSFDLRHFKGRTGWGRFGRGIYTSSTSSKSDDYSLSTDRWSTTKAMILAKVVVGRGYRTRYDNTSLAAPPVGYDSVLGEVGAQLNYDEVVVYSNDAIRPAYLVLYD